MSGRCCLWFFFFFFSLGDFYVPHPSRFRWIAFLEYHPFAKWGCPLWWTAGQWFPRYRICACQLHLSVFQSPVQLSAHTLPHSHPPLGETGCQATLCLLSCTSLFPERGQMFGSLSVTGWCQDSQCKGQNRGQDGGEEWGHVKHPNQVFLHLDNFSVPPRWRLTCRFEIVDLPLHRN